MSQALVTQVETQAEAGLSFEKLYRQSRDDVYAYVGGLLRDASAAEEVTATAFERAYRKRDRFDPRRGSARAWLFGIARNAALDELRHHKRQGALSAEPIDLAAPSGADGIERSERRLLLAAALERLVPRERELVALKNYDGSVPRSGSGPNAFRTSRRDVERSARLVLATEPSEVRAAAARVFETVHAFDGIVLRSSISAGADTEANAVFDLLIPSGKLGDALAGFSEIADVRSRQEASGDVTGRTTGLEETLRDRRARIDGLLAQLANADTESERDAVEAQLRSERRRLAGLRSALQSLERRVNLSRVSLRIEGGSSGIGDDDGWGVSDALDDAGRILAIAAGVTLIGLAILAPLVLLAAIAWLGGRAWTRRNRERALS